MAALRNPDVPLGGKLSCDPSERNRCHRILTPASGHAACWRSLVALAEVTSGASPSLERKGVGVRMPTCCSACCN
jgi:hypothetical protein